MLSERRSGAAGQVSSVVTAAAWVPAVPQVQPLAPELLHAAWALPPPPPPKKEEKKPPAFSFSTNINITQVVFSLEKQKIYSWHNLERVKGSFRVF